MFFFTVSAAATIANIVKSSLGPVGLDKMLVDDVGVSRHTHAHTPGPWANCVQHAKRVLRELFYEFGSMELKER